MYPRRRWQVPQTAQIMGEKWGHFHGGRCRTCPQGIHDTMCKRDRVRLEGGHDNTASSKKSPTNPGPSLSKDAV